MIPPVALWKRIKLETAGVEKIPFWPINNRETPLAAQILMILSTASFK
jgi:hypothetical protein